MGVTLILFVLCFEETKFNASAIVNLEMVSPSAPNRERVNLPDTDDENLKIEDKTPLPNFSDPLGGSAGCIDHSIPLRTYRQRITLLTTTPGNPGQFLKHFYGPLEVIIMFPAVAYVTLLYSSLLVWYAVLATTQSQYFSMPPYNFGTSGIGLINLAPFIGSVIGAVWAGPVSDWSIQRLARRNKGIYEPEMRLYISILPGLLGPAGLFLFGYGTAQVSASNLPALIKTRSSLKPAGHAMDIPLPRIRLIWL